MEYVHEVRRGAGGRMGDDRQREQRILEYLPLARSLARRYDHRGEPLEDIVQIATLGLIKAVDRFDPSRGVDFKQFATPTILGEIRRHFRDRTWMVHVPRSVQDAHKRVNQLIQELTGRLGHTPSVAEIAAAADMSDEEVLDAMAAGRAYHPLSLSHPLRPTDDELPEIPVNEPGFEWAEGRAALGEKVSELSEREQTVLVLRFQAGLAQHEIADRIGVSQMHVSRILRSAIATLRSRIGPVG